MNIPRRRASAEDGAAILVGIAGRLMRTPSSMRALLLVTIAATLSLSCGHAAPGRSVAVAPGSVARSSASHVVTIVMENREYGAIVGNRAAPFVNGLARRYGLATSSYGVRHPSLPDYLALTSGSTHGIDSDCTGCHVDAHNIVDQLESARIGWKAYMEDMPRPCFRGAGSGGYAKKHNPFAYYDDVAGDPARCRRIVPLSQLSADLRRGTLPTYAFISPNLCDDMHDCGVATGDRFLSRLVPALLRALGPKGYLVLTWDEGESDRGCCGGSRGGRIATLVAGRPVRRGARERRPLDHYGVLRTIEDTLGLRRLGAAADARHGSLDGLFRRPPRFGDGAS
jgi:phosphatidylinositol-3-phosphatase